MNKEGDMYHGNSKEQQGREKRTVFEGFDRVHRVGRSLDDYGSA
jgi:hypothetical protein